MTKRIVERNLNEHIEQENRAYREIIRKKAGEKEHSPKGDFSNPKPYSNASFIADFKPTLLSSLIATKRGAVRRAVFTGNQEKEKQMITLEKIIQAMRPVSTKEFHQHPRETHPAAGGYYSIITNKDLMPVSAQRFDERGRIIEEWLADEVIRTATSL